MRLYDYLQKLRDLAPNLIVTLANQAGNQVHVQNLQQVRTAIRQMLDVGIFEEFTSALTTMNDIYFNENKFAIVHTNLSSQLSGIFEEVRKQTVLCTNVLQKLVKEEDELQLNILLPSVSDLGGLQENIKTLDTVFNQVLTNEHFDGKVTLKGFDVGSEWISLIFSDVNALAMIGGIFAIAASFISKVRKDNQTVEQMKALDIKKESLEDIRKSQKKLLDAYVKHETQNLLNRRLTKKIDPEYPNRVMNSIVELSNLIDKGLQAFPALNTPELTKEEMPDFRKPIEQLDRTRQIPESLNNSAENSSEP